jgi:hypothetical protein
MYPFLFIVSAMLAASAPPPPELDPKRPPRRGRRSPAGPVPASEWGDLVELDEDDSDRFVRAMNKRQRKAERRLREARRETVR